MRISTGCSAHQHPEFVLGCSDDIPPSDLDWLISVLEQSVENGKMYVPSQTVYIGWIPTTVEKYDENLLTLIEPDMKSFPFSWHDGVTNTLRHLRVQKDVVEGVGLVPLFPKAEESAIIGVDLKERDVDIVMDRGLPKGDGSGWFIGRMQTCLDYNDPSNLELVSLYEASLMCGGIVPYLACPVRTRIEIEHGAVSLYKEGVALAPRPGSILERMLGTNP